MAYTVAHEGEQRSEIQFSALRTVAPEARATSLAVFLGNTLLRSVEKRKLWWFAVVALTSAVPYAGFQQQGAASEETGCGRCREFQ
jgi:hypothetical protein